MPTLFADPTDLRRFAARLNSAADAVRLTRDRVGRNAARVAWHGSAAGAFGLALHPALVAVTRSAARIDDAADALRRLAVAVEEFLDDLARAARAGAGLVQDGLGTVADLFIAPADVPGDLLDVAADTGALLAGVADLLGI